MAEKVTLRSKINGIIWHNRFKGDAMKKLTFALLILIISGCASVGQINKGSARLTFENNVDLSREAIFSNIIYWINNNQGGGNLTDLQKMSVKTVQDYLIIELADIKNGLINCKGFKSIDIDPLFGVRTPFIYNAGFRIKDGKYKVEFNNIKQVDYGFDLNSYDVSKVEKAADEFREINDDINKHLASIEY
jgi:hypothetical protein